MDGLAPPLVMFVHAVPFHSHLSATPDSSTPSQSTVTPRVASYAMPIVNVEVGLDPLGVTFVHVLPFHSQVSLTGVSPRSPGSPPPNSTVTLRFASNAMTSRFLPEGLAPAGVTF